MTDIDKVRSYDEMKQRDHDRKAAAIVAASFAKTADDLSAAVGGPHIGIRYSSTVDRIEIDVTVDGHGYRTVASTMQNALSLLLVAIIKDERQRRQGKPVAEPGVHSE
jgi:hypothetical protein